MGIGRRNAPLNRDGEAGQASAELVAIVPVLIVLVLALGEAASAGYAAWTAANAARAGARAAEVGGDAERVALSTLPDPLRERASVEVGEAVEVRVKAPALLPGVPALSLSASSALDPEAGDGI